MSDRGIVLAQARMAILVALRTPRTIIFTALFPLVLLVLFNSIFSGGSEETATLPGDLKLSAEAYFTAGIIAYAVALSTFTTLAVSLTTQRENGQLKRYRRCRVGVGGEAAERDPQRAHRRRPEQDVEDEGGEGRAGDGDLVASEKTTGCPYKGWTSRYWSVQVGDVLHPDLAWSYEFPIPALAQIAGLVAFFDEKVDVVLDGEPLSRPQTPFS
jgi:hypothetical protein